MMQSYKSYSPIEMVHLLAAATVTYRVRWTRLPDYLFYNGRNKAVSTYADMFSGVDTPTMLDDPPKADLRKSFYCEYGTSSFCLMYCQEVHEVGKPLLPFYHFLVQPTQFSNFIYYTRNEEEFQKELFNLSEMVERQIHASYSDSIPLYKSLYALEKDIATFDPFTEPLPVEPVPAPRDSYKHCCVVDANNNYVEFVLVHTKNEKGEPIEEIDSYALKEGEWLLETLPPSKIIKAHWNGSAWEEAATPEEIADYRRTHRY